MRRSHRIAFWIVVALQVLGLLSFAGVREATMQSGREIVLRSAPVDPRDLFRGDYVVLRYEISSLPYCCFAIGDTVYVLLERRDDVWDPAGARRDPPSADDGPFIRGRVTRVTPTTGRQRTSTIEVEYGIESYFVPEGTGREIERARGQMRVVVAVDGWGNGQIKQLLLDG